VQSTTSGRLQSSGAETAFYHRTAAADGKILHTGKRWVQAARERLSVAEM